MRQFDVVVVNHRTPALVAGLLHSLAGWCDGHAESRIVVDAASDDESLEGLGRLSGQVRLLPLERNRGFAASANAGAAAGAARWLLFLNPDVRIAPAALATLPAWASGDRVIGGVNSAGPRAHGPVRARLPGNALAVDWVAGSLMALPRRRFEEAGGFDESFFMYLEDVDLCERLRDRGVPSVVLPSLVHSHAGGASYAASDRDRASDFRASRRLYLERRHGMPVALVYGAYAALRAWLRFPTGRSRVAEGPAGLGRGAAR